MILFIVTSLNERHVIVGSVIGRGTCRVKQGDRGRGVVVAAGKSATVFAINIAHVLVGIIVLVEISGVNHH
jgi:hypothetical protein